MMEQILIVEPGAELMQQVFALRHEVFVIEQRVPVALEIDEQDAHATHLLMLQHDRAVATLRLVAYGDMIKVGRVAVRRQLRRQGLGTQLMRQGIRHAAASACRTLMLDAQVDSMPFYRRLGFVEEGEVFDDAGIPHRRMVLKL